MTSVFNKAFAEGVRPIRDLTVSEFAEEYIYNPPNSADAGKFSIHRAPYQKAIMDALTPNNGINRVTFMAGARIGKTFIANVWQAYIFAIDPQNFICYEPTIQLAEDYSSSQINTLIDSTPILKEVFEKGKNSVAKKEYKGCIAYYKGANSGNSFRQIAAPYIYADEVDSYEADIDGEGSPMKLIENRQATYGRKRKLFDTSTPTIKDFSLVEAGFLQGNQQYYHVPCPHCKVKQVLKIGQLRYEINELNKTVDPNSVYYECIACNHKITEDKKTYMLANGEWIAENHNAPKEHVSFHICSLYAPLGWYGWPKMAQDWEESKSDELSRKSFVNTKLGETYYEKSEQPNALKIKERAERYDLMTINENAVNLYAGVDTQDNRLALHVIAIGEEGETWIVNYEEINGSPADPSTWERLDMLVRRPYKHDAGVDLFIKACAVDTGGHFGPNVYDFVRKNSDKYFAIKGASTDIGHYFKEGNQVDKGNGGLSLWLVNTQLIKKYIYINLNVMLQTGKTEGAKVIHFSDELQRNYFEMLTSERLVKKVVNGAYKESWVLPKGTRNEALDTLVYAYALAFHFSMVKLYGKTYKDIWDINIGKRIKMKEEPKKVENKQSPKARSSWMNKNGFSIK